ncbi:hypothetical protein WICMUC_002545 [Wickerhamomyces mucosus]|uniref:SP-RING-type domain-containing protein n=1 Tax=Wickerhamomyces mucosus TaxID=1378264 RepID=A0A9P8PNR2_9ASCO|nr:hypothetical protein WICMUC_002545 [Wickerhamomyces mucosus]
MELPQYFPLPSDTNFEKVKNLSIKDEELAGTEKDILDSAKYYLDLILEERGKTSSSIYKTDVLVDLLSSYEKLVKTRIESKYFSDRFNFVKNEIKQRSRTEEQISNKNIERFGVGNKTQSFSKILESKLEAQKHKISEQVIRQTIMQNPDYKFLKYAPFIIEDPLKPLPEENDGENDDLEVEGGIVDLKCPISYKLYEAPFISKVCSHVFDKTAIANTFSGTSKKCPIPGCGALLTVKDFAPDRVMELRVKSHKIHEKQKSKNSKIERL